MTVLELELSVLVSLLIVYVVLSVLLMARSAFRTFRGAGVGMVGRCSVEWVGDICLGMTGRRRVMCALGAIVGLVSKLKGPWQPLATLPFC